VRTARKTSLVRTSVAVGAALLTGMVVLPQSGYATPEPTIEEAQRRVDRLFHEAEVAQERVNTIKVELKDARQQLKGLRADVRSQERTLEATQERVGDMVAMQAQQNPVGMTTQLLASDDPDEFLAGLAAMQSYNTTQASVMAGYQEAAAELDLRKEQLREQVDAIAKAKDEADQQLKTVEEKHAAAEDLLEELEAEQIVDISRDDTDRPPTDIPDTSDAAAIAVDFALDQLGDPYVYGAAGPDSYDCSGLTMAAWAAAGVSLSHSSSVQAATGTSIPLDAAQPGDLLFYYSPVSHVGMYIGNGQIVHAPNSGSVVEIVPATGYMPLTDVRRVG
jgi:peptidoglycan DL-endopeptidase CwlO